jgi:hypothetical protein
VTEFTETSYRHYCRNPKCKAKLPTPVSNPKEAFCSLKPGGCADRYYRLRCYVCEERKAGRLDARTCGRRKCKNAIRSQKGPATTSRVEIGSKTSINTGTFSREKDPRGWSWRVRAAGSPITANQYHCATVGANEAIAVADRVNAAHWKAARAGERGYRKVAP